MTMEKNQCPKCGFQLPRPAPECPRCGLVFSKYKPPASRQKITAERTEEKPAEIENHFFDVLFPVIPLVGILLLWYLVWGATLFVAQERLVYITTAVVVGGAVMVGADAVRLRIGGAGGYGPTLWTLGSLVLWVVFYPAYLFIREKHGAKTFALVGTVCAVVFAGSAIYLGYHIMEAKKLVSDGLKSLMDTMKILQP